MDEPRKRRHLVLRVEPDPDLESPNDFDCTWKLHSFGRRHASYTDPEELGLSLEQNDDRAPKVINPGLRTKLRVGLAFWLSYFEHGNCIWMLNRNPKPGVEFRWDGVRFAGILIWEHPPDEIGAKTYEDRAKDAEGFLKEYTAWANGEGCWYSLTTDDGTDVNSCGGYYTFEHMMGCVRNEVDFGAYPEWPIVIEGDLKSMLQYEKIEGHEYVDSVEELEDMEEPEYVI